MANAPERHTGGSPNEEFFKYFQRQITALQEQMARLKHVSPVGGERHDGVEHCLAGITRLSREVQDASSYLPGYDQRTYAAAIKALTERLQGIRASFAPKQKFAFKTIPKNESAMSLKDMAELEKLKRGNLSVPSEDDQGYSSDDLSAQLADSRPHSPELKGVDDALGSGTSPKPAKNFEMSGEVGTHIIMPQHANHATASAILENIIRSVFDLSMRTPTGKPYANITLRNARNCVFICGQTSGPIHITKITDCVVVVTCRQFRMHDCSNVDVYLHCASRPIIEDCTDIRFAPLPRAYLDDATEQAPNNWDQVDDFKWLKSEPSPNWRILPEYEQPAEDTWTEIAPGAPGIGVDDIIRAVKGVKGATTA